VFGVVFFFFFFRWRFGILDFVVEGKRMEFHILHMGVIIKL
jgi:hypothetical protein